MPATCRSCKALIDKTPCGKCRVNAAAFFKATPPDFSTRDSYFKWTVDFHNSASADAGHAPLTLAEATARWRKPATVAPTP